MARRLITFATIAAVLLSFGTLGVIAGDTKPADQAAKTAAATTAAKAEEAQKMAVAANFIAVCGCGKAFTPTASTPYVTQGGKQYTCCSEACHKMASADLAGAAKKADEITSKTLAQLTKSSTATTASKPN